MDFDSFAIEKRGKRVSSVPIAIRLQGSEDEEEREELSMSLLPALSPLKSTLEPSRPPRKSELLHRFQRKLTHPEEDSDFIEELRDTENLPDMQRNPSLSQAERYTQQVESTTITAPESHPIMHEVLGRIVGFDSVDDESMLEKVTSFKNYKQVLPRDWIVTDNPPYSYWSYYIYANLYVLNRLRSARGLNTFAFRPHCGEAGSHDHLACAFLTAHSVNHGIELHNNPVLQYMFYIRQIGLSMSPLSNNKLFLRYDKNPFPVFLKRGMNVALSTDDPLMIHLTKEPLLEEYSVAAQVYKLSQVDLCEIVRNSILQSGFSDENKRAWLGTNFAEGTPDSNDIEKTNHSRIRYMYRYETFHLEMQFLKQCAEVD